MKSLAPVYAIAVLITAMIVAGAQFAVFYNGNYSAEASRNGDTIEYSVQSAGQETFGVVALSGQKLESVVIYADPGYLDRQVIGSMSVGARMPTPEHFAGQLTTVLKQRGISDVSTVNAQGLLSVCRDEGTAAGKAIVSVSGALPDTVYDGTRSSPILSWIDAGGTLYWAGNVIGMYSASASAISEHPSGPSLFIGDSDWCSSKDRYCTESYGDLAGILGLRGTDLLFAPEMGGNVYSTGYSDGTYSTVSYLRHGSGEICIISGALVPDHYFTMSQLICSGTSYGSEILGSVSGTVNHTSVSGSFVLSDPSEDVTVYVFIGKGADYTVYGRSFRIDQP